MPDIIITRSTTSQPTLTRGRVKEGMLFSKVLKGVRSSKIYASIGRNGKMFSVNTQTKELASSTKENGSVVVRGSFRYKLTRTPGEGRLTTRSQVANGEVFTSEVVTAGNEKKPLYGHLGRVTSDSNAFLSVNFGSGDYAKAHNGNARVRVVGTFQLECQVVN